MKPKRNYTPGPMDNCMTPGYALEPLKMAVPDIARYLIWEPAQGDGNLVNEIRKQIGPAHGSDIIDGVDFLNSILQQGDFAWNAIVTNPPWGIRGEFTGRCLQLGRPFALLMQSETVSLKWFHELIEMYEEAPHIVWFSPRINFKMPEKGWQGGGAQMPTAWFTWRMLPPGNTFIKIDHWTKAYRAEFEK